MRTEIEINPKDIVKIVKTINNHLNEEISLDDLLLRLLKEGVTSSDYLFIILSKLQERELVDGRHGILFIKKEVERGILKELEKKLNYEVSRKKKIFVTPLEVGKFYQCPRRFYLEKIVLSRQFKRERGRVWDGEALHSAVKMFIDNISKKNVDELITEISRMSMGKYRGKTTITEKSVEDFLIKLHELIKEENFDFLISERTLLSLKGGLMGTPDIIARDENGEFVPIDVKLGRIDKRGLKKEHLLQNVGEALLVEDFLRKPINRSYLIYFQASSAMNVNLTDGMKKEFMLFKKELERVSTKKIIPHVSRLENARVRVCRGCHVRPACENIEELIRIKGR
ncbi:MAG: PD-(D/E)XK nuclease family protein [Candidatus Wukongarchaeota archaeon]|nr:PD-(D/E)XK nuclease family protein [Candidatus Wukongarchaeota archaeon]